MLLLLVTALTLFPSSLLPPPLPPLLPTQTIVEHQAAAMTLPSFTNSSFSPSSNTLPPNNDEFASVAGLSLSFAIGVTGLLNWTVRSFAQMEAGMNSTERILHYTNNIPSEKKGGRFDANFKKLKDGKVVGTFDEAMSDWPKTGTLVVKNLRMRYRATTELVLKGVTFTIQSGQRVGVVGRTGAGKSSLMLCLLRLVEPEMNRKGDEPGSEEEGPIVWDGVDTSTLSLEMLRSHIGIIPQTPTLFSGTIRSNLDPFEQSTDEELWAALEKCELTDAIKNMSDGLDSEVAEYGENMSQGQRQLLCLGRALLRNCKLLLLDEATSSIDRATDALVQRTIRTSFQGVTILTIAHRVETIIDNDLIMVMEDGRVAEMDSPKALLTNESTLFSGIVKEMGEDVHGSFLELLNGGGASTE